ncbi:MAG: helix-turn-helix domain-containing protein [Peptococcaceae bacterium]|nr:helix-turn-helix domain-containing protein [Peptococcaceae bacterium]
MEEYLRSRVPWSTGPSLKQKTDELGVDFDRFIEGLKCNLPDMEMAREFGVSEKAIKHLKDHFMTRGLGSIMGQD